MQWRHLKYLSSLKYKNLGNDFEVILQDIFFLVVTQPTVTCSKLIIETLEQGVKYI